MKKLLLSALMVFILISIFSSCQKDEGVHVNIQSPIKVAKNYTVSFEENGGSYVANVTADVLKTAPSTYREGYAFEGWYIDSSFTTPATFPFDIDSNIKLYAKWKQIYFTVDFYTNGGTFVSSKWTDTINTAPKTQRNGYAFAGWYKDETFINPAAFPMLVTKNTALYAKWLKTDALIQMKDVSIKFLDNDYNYGAVGADITPTGFDYDGLIALGYSRIKITLSYDVCYTKSYNVPFDIGYFGSPKYEVSMLNKNLEGELQSNLNTSTSKQRRSIYTVENLSTLRNECIKISFSSDNIQNIIHFSNIVITYEVY